MKLRVVEHFSKETGKFLCYELQYKPFLLWPVWKKLGTDCWTKDKSELEQNIVYLLTVDGKISNAREYH